MSYNRLESWFNKAQKLGEKEKYLEAIKYYKKVLSDDKSQKGAWVNIGWCYNRLKKPNEAIKYCKWALEIIG